MYILSLIQDQLQNEQLVWLHFQYRMKLVQRSTLKTYRVSV